MIPSPQSFKSLETQVSLCWPGPRLMPIVSGRSGHGPAGQGHNATTVFVSTVVATVVAKNRAPSSGYTSPQRHNGQTSISLMCACARVHARRFMPLWRCGVVTFSYLPEKKEKKVITFHNGGHNGGSNERCGLVKPLKTLEKVGFAHG